MHIMPKTVSHGFVACISVKIELHISTNVAPCTVIPSISFICDVTIIKATADVNPDDTGPDTKSIRNPRKYF